MAKIGLGKLNLKSQNITTKLQINEELTLEVRNYLPILEKEKFIQYIVDKSMDVKTGCFSPLRVEAYFGIAICMYYAQISFTEKQLENIGKTYDLLEENHIIDKIMSVIPEDEITYTRELVDSTVQDITRYNASAAGIIQMMSNNAGDLDKQLQDIIGQIQSGEGLQALQTIKDVVEIG